MQTPILQVVFNRPVQPAQVFEQIRKARSDATHTQKRYKAKITEVTLQSVTFPLHHPQTIQADAEFDKQWLKIVQPPKPLYQKYIPVSFRKFFKAILTAFFAKS